MSGARSSMASLPRWLPGFAARCLPRRMPTRMRSDRQDRGGAQHTGRRSLVVVLGEYGLFGARARAELPREFGGSTAAALRRTRWGPIRYVPFSRLHLERRSAISEWSRRV